MGSTEEAAARECHKHTAESFLVFLSPGVWLSQQWFFCVLLSSSRMYGRARAFFGSAQWGDIGKKDSKNASIKKMSSVITVPVRETVEHGVLDMPSDAQWRSRARS